MPQTLRTVLLTGLAWFMPLHALDATTGQWHPAEAVELNSALAGVRRFLISCTVQMGD
jgi:hypothetical protein